MDITRNLFYFFRGPSAGGDQARIRQLENNLTKSLIVVLEHADREVYLGAFASLLGLRPVGKNIRFSLQRRPICALTAPKRLVVGITGGDMTLAEGHRTQKKGRPDAWILTDSWTVLIESKLGSKIDEDQLRDHARSAGWEQGSYETVFLTWQELYLVFRKEFLKQRRQIKSASHLLISEWLAYLKGQQMVPFEKLEADDFDYFNLPAEDKRAVMNHVHSRIEAFRRLVAESEPAKRFIRSFDGELTTEWKHSARKVNEIGAWFNVGGSGSARTWHATAFFRSQGIGVEVLGSGKSLTRRFVRMGSDKARALVHLCAECSDELPIVVGCRRAWYADPKSGYKGQHIDRTDEPLMGHPRTLGETGADKFADVLFALLDVRDKRFRAEVILRYAISRKDLIDADITGQVALVGRALNKLNEPLLFLLREA